MYDLKRIKRDCFWDYNFTEEEIEKLAKSNNFREKQFLFEKIGSLVIYLVNHVLQLPSCDLLFMFLEKAIFIFLFYFISKK